MAKDLTPAEVEEIREAFNLFDTDGSGAIEPSELRVTLQSLGFETKNATIYAMLEDLDKDKSGSIEFNEFLDLMCANSTGLTTKEDIDRVFDMFDVDGTNSLSVANLRAVADDLGESITDAELSQMIDRADLNQDGVISRQEFHAIISSAFLRAGK
mmetsp:Transcript_71791/g.149956  ORF Transcript_71791/g.149956 Transcript_71791/m.149956 type:complete len:156 (+) Transcript_71791:820-1287(+)